MLRWRIAEPATFSPRNIGNLGPEHVVQYVPFKRQGDTAKDCEFEWSQEIKQY